MIEKATFDVDGGYGDEPPYHTKAFLILEGDFVDSFSDYLDGNADSVTLEIDRRQAEKLHKELGEALTW